MSEITEEWFFVYVHDVPDSRTLVVLEDDNVGARVAWRTKFSDEMPNLRARAATFEEVAQHKREEYKL